MKKWTMEEKVKITHTKHPEGFTMLELDIFLFKNHIDKDRVKEIMGVNTVCIKNGDVVFYKRDIIKALMTYIDEKNKQQN